MWETTQSSSMEGVVGGPKDPGSRTEALVAPIYSSTKVVQVGSVLSFCLGGPEREDYNQGNLRYHCLGVQFGSIHSGGHLNKSVSRLPAWIR